MGNQPPTTKRAAPDVNSSFGRPTFGVKRQRITSDESSSSATSSDPAQSTENSTIEPDHSIWDQSFNQLNNQSHNHPSHLANLPSSIFALLCSFLELESKVCKLPVLSRAVRAAFDPAQCCKDQIVIDFGCGTNLTRSTNIYQRESRLLSYCQFASSVSISLTCLDTVPGIDAHAITAACNAAIDNPSLSSLCLSEYYGRRSVAVVPAMARLFVRTPAQLRNLKSLLIKCVQINHPAVAAINQSRVHAEQTLHFRGLVNCQSLQSCCIMIAPDQDLDIIQFLPACLTFLQLEAHDCHWENGSIASKLTDPLFLPHLRHLHGEHQEQLLDGLSTVMSQTGLPRPIEQLSLALVNDSDLSSFNRLHTLVIDLTDHVHVLSSISDKTLPQLRTLHATIRMTHHEDHIFLPFFLFLSKRRIEDFQLMLRPKRSSEMNQVAAFSNEAIETLFQISSLKSLSISEECTLFCNCLITRMSERPLLHHLTRLCLSGQIVHPNMGTIEPLLNVTSNLRTLIIMKAPGGWALLLPLIANCCRHIEEIVMKSSINGVRHSIELLRSAFASHPLDQLSFQHLKRVELSGNALEDDAFDFLIMQLSTAPRLTHFTCGLLPARVHLMSNLPHLATLYRSDRQYFNHITHVMFPSGDKVSIFRKPRTGIPDEYWFRTIYDCPALDGRATFFRLVSIT